MKFEKSCGCIVLNKKHEVLLIHSTKGHWGIPKGHMEPGETEVETAIREVKEETNIDVMILNKHKKYTESYSPEEGVMKEVVYFIAKNTSNDIQAQTEEVSEIKWLTLQEAISMITFDNTKELIKTVKKELEEEKLC